MSLFENVCSKAAATVLAATMLGFFREWIN
jgi:hypothetical protein